MHLAGDKYRDRTGQARGLQFRRIEGPTATTSVTGDEGPCSQAGGQKTGTTLVNWQPLRELNH
jgi:hypothetical protein